LFSTPKPKENQRVIQLEERKKYVIVLLAVRQWVG
jgi:hypothetical protein